MSKINLDEIHKKGYLIKDEVLNKLEDYYFIEITPRTLKYYGTIGLINSGIKENIKGIVGSVSLYPNNTPEIIFLIKLLQVETNMSLNEIREYFKVLNLEDEYFKKFLKIAIECNKIGDPDKKMEKLLEDKKIPKEQWGERLSELYQFKNNFWNERKKYLKIQEYITNFRFVAINKALAELGLLDITLDIENIEDYTSAGKLEVGKNSITVIFKELVNKKVIFLKNKIEIKNL